MRRFLLIILLFSAIQSGAQDSVKLSPDSVAISQPSTIPTDSSMLDKSTTDQMDRNLQAFVRAQKKRQEAEKRKSFMYIGLGLFFLVVLIVGLRRKGKSAVK